MDNHISGQSNEPLSKPAHALEREIVGKELNSHTVDGLTLQEAKARLEKYGRNELDDGPGVQPFKILLNQVANAMMLVRLLATN
jgi:P-type Na+/K+ transporter